MIDLQLAVHVPQPGARHAVLDLSLQLATRLGARLDGVYAAALPGATFAVPEAVTLQVQETERARRAAEAQAGWWAGLLRDSGLRGSWRVGEGDLAEVLSMAAASTDLLLLQRPEVREDAPIGFGSTSRTVFAAGRPVLVVPAVGAGSTGHRVLVAWNGSIEATRALHGAAPLLAQADAVHVLDGSRERGPEGMAWLPPVPLPTWFEQRGIHASIERFESHGAPAPAILARAQALNSDLIVMGAWGHSRLAEMVLGGVTRALFRDCPLPLLVAH